MKIIAYKNHLALATELRKDGITHHYLVTSYQGRSYHLYLLHAQHEHNHVPTTKISESSAKEELNRIYDSGTIRPLYNHDESFYADHWERQMR